ncbi:hypothetical protein RHMOL_Rhmol10G0001400 [Rhododendron molle]|uniref:Uncharacterized protein n=1 Tax=Rhododendron molle TaxID=49168 RepID=A0ACC0LXV0_RHOML|nr:hypothetical protein RHMOL_Rhmol10G0001400 [Rhododendron molle]
MQFFGVSHQVLLLHHVQVVVEVAVPQCQPLQSPGWTPKEQLQPQVQHRNLEFDCGLGNGLVRMKFPNV